MRLKDKIVIVTGAGTGIGEGIALKFASEGANVVIADINEDSGKKVTEIIIKMGRKSISIKTDVTDENSVKAMVDKTMEELGRIDVLVNNAGVSKMAKFVDISEKDYDFNMDVNLTGAFIVSQAVSNVMKAQKSGKIIFTISMAAKTGSAFYAHYNASKAALLAYMQALAMELAPNINVNGICPGIVNTSMHEREIKWTAELRGISEDMVKSEYLAGIPLARFEEPSDVANLVLFLASDEGNYITGQAINITGGMVLRK